MPPDPIIVDDEEYASSEDSDFAPDEAPEQDAAAASSDDDDDNAAAAAPAKTRKKAGDSDAAAAAAPAVAQDAGFENSGDEAIIERGRKRQKKADRRAQLEQGDDDDEGGEGGLIKTRSMRAVEKAERKAQPVAGPVTIDVDALWASMTAAPVVPQPSRANGFASGISQPDQQVDSTTATPKQPNGPATTPANTSKDTDKIKIKRTYNFAGKVHTEEKLVPRDSAEARLYLASHPQGGDAESENANTNGAAAADDDAQQPDKRIPRKAFRSAYEPALLASEDGQRADLDLGLAVRLQARHDAKAAARKLNTVEKSRMDWAGFVDKEGIKDELVLAGRAKGNFAGQQDFLARTEARRENDARRVRLAGKTS